MAPSMSPSREQFKIGVICAVSIELDAARAILEEEYPCSESASQIDSNTYTLGRIGQHNVVILPSYGSISAAQTAASMLTSFPAIKYGFLVGIGGRAPLAEPDVRLGDVVVSSGIIEYDFGNSVSNKDFIRKGTLNRPSPILLNTVQKANRKRSDNLLALSKAVNQRSRYYNNHTHDSDELSFKAGEKNEEARTPEFRGHQINNNSLPIIPLMHYSDSFCSTEIVRAGTTQDILLCGVDIFLLNTEAAGLCNKLPSLAVRGIHDKKAISRNDDWQCCASAAALSFVNEVIKLVPVSALSESASAQDVLHSILDSTNNFGNNLRLRRLRKEAEVKKDKLCNGIEQEPNVHSKRALQEDSHHKSIQGHISWSGTSSADIMKLSSAYALSAGISLFAPEILIPRSISSLILYRTKSEQIILGPDRTLLGEYSLLGIDATMVLIYWTIWFSLVLDSPWRQHRLLYCFWAYVMIFLGGASLQCDLGMLGVVVLPAAMNLTLSYCMLEERFSRRPFVGLV